MNLNCHHVIIGVRCHYCSKSRSPREVIYLPGGKMLCWRCYEWHGHAMGLLAKGEPPPGCQECGAKFDAMQEVNARGDMPVYLHPKDGVYQVLCGKCSDAYVQKRADLYGSTQYGRLQKLT